MNKLTMGAKYMERGGGRQIDIEVNRGSQTKNQKENRKKVCNTTKRQFFDIIRGYLR